MAEDKAVHPTPGQNGYNERSATPMPTPNQATRPPASSGQNSGQGKR